MCVGSVWWTYVCTVDQSIVGSRDGDAHSHHEARRHSVRGVGHLGHAMWMGRADEMDRMAADEVWKRGKCEQN